MPVGERVFAPLMAICGVSESARSSLKVAVMVMDAPDL
jgi:hypothetical protein